MSRSSARCRRARGPARSVLVASFALQVSTLVVGVPREAAAGPRAETFHFTPSSATDLASAERIIRDRSVDASTASLAVDLAAADRHQAGLLPNPTFDFTWGTIPLGRSNPPNLANQFANVPNYNFGLSYTIPIGKVGPREDSADATLRGTEDQRDAVVRNDALQLLRVLGSLAVIELRSGGLTALRDDARRDVDTARVRLKAGFGDELDIERLTVERSRADQELASSESDKEQAIATCAALVGGTCDDFASEDEARAFLSAWIDRVPMATPDLAEREDVRALDAFRDAAVADRSLAKAQAIPDPTVRLGYTYDRFVASGNQENSLNLTLSFPLPLFDHGQAAIETADVKAARYREQHGRLVDAARVRVPTLLRRLAAQRARAALLATDALPRAKSVLADIEKSEVANLIPVDQLISAHRAVGELLLEQADSYSDAFGAALDLAAELPPQATWTAAPQVAPAADGDPSDAQTPPPTAAPMAPPSDAHAPSKP